jgi:hypothetical protein
VEQFAVPETTESSSPFTNPLKEYVNGGFTSP